MSKIRHIINLDKIGVSKKFRQIYSIKKKDYILWVGFEDAVDGEFGDIILPRFRIAVVRDDGEKYDAKYIDLEVSDILELIEYLKVMTKVAIKKELEQMNR